MTHTIQLISLNVGKPKTYNWDNKELSTGICKEPVKEVFLSINEFEGDGVANPEFHGGPDRAVCLYSYEHYAMWETEYNTSLPIPAFGENLTVTHMLEKDVCIGDIYEVGGTILQVTQGRIPCNTISKRNQIDTMLARIVESCFTGFFMKVLKEGTVRSDSKLQLLERHPKQVSVLFANQILFHDRDNIEGIKRILNVDVLAAVWQTKLNRLLHNPK